MTSTRILKSVVATVLFITTSVAQAKSRQTTHVEPDPLQATIQKLAEQRKKQIARLKAYRQAGAFPQNNIRLGMVNIFVDDNGNLCAMANLIAKSGNRALVDQTAASNNFIRLGEVTDGPLMSWILKSGLTQEEVNLIQEPDSFIGREPGVQEVDPELWAIEQQRLRDHLAMVTKRLEKDTQKSLKLAAQRLLRDNRKG